LSFIPGGVAIITILMVISLWKTNIGGNRHEIITPERTRLVPIESHVNDSECDEQAPMIA
ncbi:unnamed protein product, partial [Adineta steineri]